VYGLAADAFDPRACRKIFSAKGRPTSDPFIVHIASREALAEVAITNSAALVLAKKFWPGPLTMVLPKAKGVPDIVSANLPSVAVRMPAHPLFRRLIKLSGRPLAAPSANPFGYISPTTAAHVQANLGQKIDYILDGGASEIGLESTIIDLRDPARPRLLRPGAISREKLAAALGRPVKLASRASGKTSVSQVAPGLLSRHYSPRTPLLLHPRLSLNLVSKGQSDEAWLFIARPSGCFGQNVFWLDSFGNLHGAARRLFACLRTLDSAGYRIIHAERATGCGPTEAINDRLRRAAAQ
jgi:L-threonylcarbamoyladenylate synthase